MTEKNIPENKPAVAIIGAGLSGCFLAVLLAKRGYPVHVYERFSRKETLAAPSQRAYNLTLYGYAVDILREAGLWNAVEPVLLPLEGSVTYATSRRNCRPIFSHFDDSLPYYAVPRVRLLEAIISQADLNPLIAFHFETALLSIDRRKRTMTVRDEASGTCSTVGYGLIVGADGVNSLVRPLMQQGQETSHRQANTNWSYKQITVGPETSERLGLRKNIAYAWTRSNAAIVGHPNKDGSMTAVFILPDKDGDGFDSLASASAVRSFFERNFPSLLPALPDITCALLNNRKGSFATLHTSPWYYGDFIAIAGDAAHAFPPFYGQGVSAGFGDCVELARLTDLYKGDWSRILPAYQEARKRNMDVLGELSLQGLFRYRRQTRASYAAVYDRVDSILHRLFPAFFRPPLFVSIAMDPGRAADAFRKHRRQRILTWFLGIPLAVLVVTGLIRLKEAVERAVRIFPEKPASTSQPPSAQTLDGI
jgi:kynurenine 3-monooxygenase